jgi:hypothetical protein
MKSFGVGSIAVLLGLALVGCGGESKPANSAENAGEAATEAPPAAAPAKPSGMAMTGQLGEIDKAATQRKFESLGGKLAACVGQSHEKVPQVAGAVAFFLRVGEDGKARYAYLEDSTLGDRDAEKCMLSALTAADWPKPQGGEAEVRQSLQFDADGNTRAPAEWPSDKVSASVAKQIAAIDACKAGAAGKLKVTAYVEPAGKEGKVKAAGASVSDKDVDAKVDCVIGVVKGLKVPSPGSYVAKVTFAL